MSDQPFTRRTSYGPSSPTVGSRGARTRQQILDAAVARFADEGFHNTSVDDIADAADTSRATLYQYFESKEAVFVELMDHAGRTLFDRTREVGTLGPTANGYEHLRCWLGEFAWVFDHYSSMFVEWANVNSPRGSLRQKLTRFLDGYVEMLSAILVRSGAKVSDAPTASILVLALVGRFHYIRHVYRPGLRDTQMLDSLAVAVQLYLFPDTPIEVLATTTAPSGRRPARPPMPRIGPLATLPPTASIAPVLPMDGVSAQAARTIRQLLDAAARVFADKGYDAATIDQIVQEASLARGTFYRYFSDKLQMISALSTEAAAEMVPMFATLGSVGESHDPQLLREWLQTYLNAHHRYSGVLRAWTEGFPVEPTLLAPAADVVRAVGAAVRAFFGPPRPYPLDRRAAGMMLAGMLEHFPTEGTGIRCEPSDAQIVEAEAQFFERVLFPA